MKKYLYLAVEYMAKAHDYIMSLNDSFSTVLTDKELHFIIIGLMGMLLFFFVHPIFKAFIRRGHEIVVSWFYVFTLVLVITFGIEIGQKISNTGSMEFADMVFGVVGFLCMFAVFAVIRLMVLFIARLCRRAEQKRSFDYED